MACVQHRENWKLNGQKERLLNAERVFQTFTENMLKWPFSGSCFHLFNPGFNCKSRPHLTWIIFASPHQSLPSVMRQWSYGGRGLVTGVFTTLVQKTCLRFHTQTSKARMNFSCFGTDALSHTTPGQSLESSLKLAIRQCSKCSKLHITSNFLICICEEKFKVVQSCHIKRTIFRWGWV